MILVNTGPTTLTKTWYVDGDPIDIGTITIGIDDAAGNEIVASGTSVTDNSDGTYEYLLAAQTEVNQLIVTWTESGGQSQTDTVEIVGGWLFTLSELQTFHSSDLASESTYPLAKLAEARAAITDEFEHICGVSFVPRYRQETLPGTGTRTLEVGRPKVQSVLDCTISGTSQTVANLVAEELIPRVHHTSGTFSSPTTANPVNVTIGYKHGHESVPADIKRAALILAHNRLQKDVTGAGVPYAASSWNDGTGQYVTFGANDKTGRWTGIPQVDSVLRRYSLRTPVI